MGKAKVTITFDAWREGQVAASQYAMEVVAPRTPLTLRPVSSRLKAALVHPSKDGMLTGLRYSPDGKRLIAGSYPGGVIQVWDAQSGKQLTKIDTGPTRPEKSELFFVSADWKTAYASRQRTRLTRFEQDGKQFWRVETDGDVRAWDLDSGALQGTFKHTPARSIISMILAPDGATFVTLDLWPGEVEEGKPPKQSASLWDVKTGRSQPLPETQARVAAYSPDSKLVAVPVQEDVRRTKEIKLFEVATAKERFSIPIREPSTFCESLTFSPDSKLLVGQVWQGGGKSQQVVLKLWDTTGGKEVASLEPENPENLTSQVFSPDGRTVASTNYVWRPGGGQAKAKLYLFDVPRGRQTKSISFTEKDLVRDPVFSADGKWIAVGTQELPDGFRNPRNPDPREQPQPRIHLIDAASGQIRETLIAPQGNSISACFSPDGKTLATGSSGKVHLWDLDKATTRSP